MSAKAHFKKVFIIACCLAVAAQAFFIPAKLAYAEIGGDYTNKISSVMKMMNDAAKMQLLTQKMQKCLSITDKNPGGAFHTAATPNNDNGEVWDKGMIWENGSMTNDVTIGSGYYLEAITGSTKTQDGKMYCGEGGDSDEGNGLFLTFVNTLKKMGVVSGSSPWQQVICNRDDPTVSGIFGRSITGGSVTVPCDTGRNVSGGTNRFYLNANYDTYLRQLYEEWVNNYDDGLGNKGNRYAVTYDGIGDYGGTANRQVGAAAYFLWVKEISVFCSGYDPSATQVFKTSQIEPRGAGESSFSTKLIWVGTEAEEGAATREISVKKEGGAPGAGGGKQSNSFGANTRTCEELIAAANAAVGNVQAEYKDILTQLCQEEITHQISDAKMTLLTRYSLNTLVGADTSAFSESDKIALQEMQQFENDGNAGKYIVDQKNSTAPPPNDKGGWQCVDADQLSFLTQIEQAEYGSDEENNTQGANPNGGGDDTVTCFDGGGALGWILCPLLETLGNAVDGIYDKIVEPFLKIDAGLLPGSGSSGGTFEAWQTFQAIANIAFIILILIVIFSQITGVGIDNYGIKKILPKLIIAAILINLSYIICQLAVDISNILGFGAKELLDSLAGQTNMVTVTEEINGAMVTSTQGVSTGATVLTAVIGVVAIGAGAAALLAGGFAFILPVLMALLSAFIAVIFVFVLLGVRQAGVIVLVVLSPLAFVCYMLPNTKKLFDKWLKMFQGLLIFFPICGLLMGGGNLVSHILLSTGSTSFWLALIAMLINVVPFFFLPTLLKGSFSAMGNIGAKISGVSTGLRKGANTKIKNSTGYKNARAGLAAGKSGGIRERMANSRFGRITGAQRGMARNRSEHLKNQREQNATDNLMGGGYAAATARMNSDVEDEKVKNEEALIMGGVDANNIGRVPAGSPPGTRSTGLQRGLEDAILSGDTSKIKAYQNVLSGKGDAGRQAVHDAMKSAQATAAASGGTVSNQARTAYSNNIMNHWAKDYKENSRSTYDYAVANTGATANGTIASHEAQSVGSLKQEHMANMDEDELQRYVTAAGTMSAADQTTLYDLAYNALNNPQISANMKEKQASILRGMLPAGYTPTNIAPGQSTTTVMTHTASGQSTVLNVRGDGTVTDATGAVVNIRDYH
jgi:hypothetical protein